MGASDSLDVLLRLAATNLLASVGGQQRAAEGTRFTDSPTAMRAYLEGLALWRRGRLDDATAAYDRAIAADTAFAQALFHRYTAQIWGQGGNFQQRAWERRDRLSLRERTVLEGIVGPERGRPRTLAQSFGHRRAAMERLPDSPDAAYFYGDLLFHYGASVDPLNHVREAGVILERAAALDSQATVLRHLLEIGLYLRDTALIRRVLPGYERTDDEGQWVGLWMGAAAIGDLPRLAALRRRTERREPVGAIAAVLSALIPSGRSRRCSTGLPEAPHQPTGRACTWSTPSPTSCAGGPAPPSACGPRARQARWRCRSSSTCCPAEASAAT